MQFVFQIQVHHFINALANLVQGVTGISVSETQTNHQPIVDLPIIDEPIVDLPIIDEPIVLLNIKEMLRPWMPSIDENIANLSLTEPLLIDFRPGDGAGCDVSTAGTCDFDASTASNGTQVSEQVRDFGDFGRSLLSEAGLSEDDFTHAVDDIFQPSSSVWQNN